MTDTNLYRLVAVSFGLICIVQAALNVLLRISLYQNTLNMEASFKNISEERDELKRKLNELANYSQMEWKYFSGSVYYVSSIQKTWEESRKDCQQRGADLIIIDSEEEQTLTRKWKDNMWIGLTDRDTEGTWKWVDGTPLTSSYWISYEPNSFDSIEEDCVEVRFHNNENNWNDKPCNLQNFWICEKTTPV